MPCTGPSKDYAYEVGDRICDELLLLMKEKHHVSAPPMPEDGFGYLIRLHEEWKELETKLRDTIRELVWADHAQF